MSGGIAYVWDGWGRFTANVNKEMVDLDPLDDEDKEWLRAAVRKHQAETDSAVASRLLGRWHEELRRFVKVMPKDYKRVLEAAAMAEEKGLSVEEAIMAASRG
jgi:glutamate synthase (NADPH/NADH) large chain